MFYFVFLEIKKNLNVCPTNKALKMTLIPPPPKIKNKTE